VSPAKPERFVSELVMNWKREDLAMKAKEENSI
jgi:hypothetical protein